MTKHVTILGLVGLSAFSVALADTTMVAPSVYEIDAGVDFSIGNSGASSFLLNWSDGSGTFTDEPDPTLILHVGQTYTFMRTTGSHPFVITDDTLPVTGTDGSYARATTDGAVIDAATLTPIADFTADPAPTTDQITWTLTSGDVGDYFYTCRVTFHTSMAGAIHVVEPSLPGDMDCDGVVGFGDINPFVLALVDGQATYEAAFPDCDYQNADVSGNGSVGFDDINPFVALLLNP